MRRRVARLIRAVLLATGLVLACAVATATATNHTAGAAADADAGAEAEVEAESGGAVLVVGFILVGSGAAVVAARLARRSRDTDDSL